MKLYNAGDRINEVLNFTLPDGHDIHVLGKWHMDAPEQSFFEVPEEMQVGMASVRVEFARDIVAKFGDRGVVLVDKNRDPQTIPPAEPIASSEQQAKEKGEAAWKAYLRKVAQAYLDEAAAIRAAGGAARAPQGFTKRALKLLNIMDPTEEVFVKAGQQQSEVDALKTELAELRALVAAKESIPPSAVSSKLKTER